MLNALNTKILLAILAVLLAIAGAVAYHRHEAEECEAGCGRQQQCRTADDPFLPVFHCEAPFGLKGWVHTVF